MLSILVAAAVVALPDSPSPEDVAKAAAIQSKVLVANLERQIAQDESALEGVEKGRTKIKVDGKDVPKAAQVKHLKAKIGEARNRLDLAKEGKWFREFPEKKADVGKGDIFSGREMTFVKSQDGHPLFQRDYAIKMNAVGEGGFGGGRSATARGTLTVLVRGLGDATLKEGKTTKILGDKFLWVAGETSFLLDGKTVFVVVLDVVDPTAAIEAVKPKG